MIMGVGVDIYAMDRFKINAKFPFEFECNECK